MCSSWRMKGRCGPFRTTRGETGTCQVHCYVESTDVNGITTSWGICNSHNSATVGARTVTFTRTTVEVVDA
jgi:hypothetical protein